LSRRLEEFGVDLILLGLRVGTQLTCSLLVAHLLLFAQRLHALFIVYRIHQQTRHCRRHLAEDSSHRPQSSMSITYLINHERMGVLRHP